MILQWMMMETYALKMYEMLQQIRLTAGRRASEDLLVNLSDDQEKWSNSRDFQCIRNNIKKNLFLNIISDK